MVGEGNGATLTGTSLRDNITGTDGNDTITAGKNNDTIITGGGHDTLNFSNGDGHDTVIISDDNTQTDFNFSSTAIISCGFEVSGNDVIVKYNKDTNNNYLDSITVKDYLLDKNENKVHDRSYDYDLFLDNYVNNVITNQSGTITGTRLKDRIYDSNSDDIIHAGKGNDTITISNAGSDYVYGEEGDDEITATQSTGNKYIDGGDGDDNIFGCNKAEYSDTIVGGLGTDNIYGSNGNDIIYGDYTLEQDATQTTGVNDNLNGGLGSDTIYGGGGDDQIQGYGNFWGSSGKDTSTGIVDRLYGGAGNDYLYGASETTYMDGGDGNDTYYMFVDQNNIISDTEGTNDIVIYNTANTTDNYYTNLHIVFNVSKNGVLDENGLRVLNTENYNTWQNNCNDENITGVKVVSGVNTFNSIQTAYSNGEGHKVTNISELISSVASWLTSGGRNYDDVSAALASSDKDTLITYIAEQTNWQSV
ncbi:hypothetical protein IJ182_08910 [bacterium]|nr:hypothetical protein [bacterium]